MGLELGMLLIIGVCIYLAGVCNGIMDSVADHYHKSLPKKLGWSDQFWDKNISWENKWAKDKNNKPIIGKENFFLSSTVLVFLTDGWHLSQSIMFSMWIIGLIIALLLTMNIMINIILLFPILFFSIWGIFIIGFYSTYR